MKPPEELWFLYFFSNKKFSDIVSSCWRTPKSVKKVNVKETSVPQTLKTKCSKPLKKEKNKFNWLSILYIKFYLNWISQTDIIPLLEKLLL